ncbi:putative bifunctional diguanylate cyclase/phosphodiesterase [Parasphingopyxis lamellibrachiae]|uniref:Diguanylate cyclase/phosphodiesterase with PAS/PAC sensor(S) n=1 Tax=Parasphingopyxis lamellibrachiae TaxID=680125 RepID=A0A3D9FDA1_9SPHN|nr:EAL domain-containing protein [Parasphingopyxis lamellibrachiae]RED15041.1 diguanylate cyclase/phosphodiesterase with PAS/PAC sensor(s) [Parasphingopyxis lamellibrachiae]
MAATDNNQLGWMEILGFHEPQGGEWKMVRAAQLRELSKNSLLPVVAVILATLSSASLFWDVVPAGMMAVWLITLIIGLLSTISARKANLARTGGARRRDIMRAIANCTIIGLFWSIPPLFFAQYGDMEQIITIAAFSLALMGASALMLNVVPLAGIMLNGLVGFSLSIMLLRMDLTLLASLVLSYTLCLTFTMLINGRAVIVRLRNDMALAEQREVVNLMLRQDDSADSDWLWQVDSRKCIVEPSQRFAAATGLSSEQLNGLPLLDILAGPTWREERLGKEVSELLSKMQAGRTFSDFTVPVILGGNQRWWKISGTPRLSANRHIMGYRGVIADVTEREAIERRIYHMAHFDTLTGLPNRAYTNELLRDRIAQAANEHAYCAFLMIDLDRFKAINDTAGHPVGDKLLAQVAERLNKLCKPDDDCGRLGGDEFAMIIADSQSSEGLDVRAREIIMSLSAPYSVDGQILHIGASVGSAIYPKDGASASSLLRKADLALYRAKDGGRGVHSPYEPALLQKAEERRAIESALRNALKKGELHLVYQPVITLATGETAGFEALLRWTNPELGSVSPDKFIAIAEETRLIDTIGEWVFREACNEAASWPEQYRLAINLSAGQLRNPRLSTAVISALSRSGIAPSRLELETTEAILNNDCEQAVNTFEQLNALGVTMALDDFGTGYSTLGFIGRTNFNSIKIDKRFIRDAQRGSKSSIAIIRAVIAMADSLGVATIAEGIENEEQYAIAERLGCSQVQGYFIDPPMNAAAVRSRIGGTDGKAVA